jgi:hypothetical protein
VPGGKEGRFIFQPAIEGCSRSFHEKSGFGVLGPFAETKGPRLPVREPAINGFEFLLRPPQTTSFDPKRGKIYFPY